MKHTSDWRCLAYLCFFVGIFGLSYVFVTQTALQHTPDIAWTQTVWAQGSSASNPPSFETNCVDGIDNDEDGFTDCSDVDCYGNNACISSSSDPATETNCADSADNDGDGFVDCTDIDCDGDNGPGGEICEPFGETRCNDSFDNDGDGSADCNDTDCDLESICASSTSSSSSFDDSGCTGQAGPGCSNTGCASGKVCRSDLIMGGCGCFDQTAEDCDDTVDNDGDGSIDCSDSDCNGDSACINSSSSFSSSTASVCNEITSCPDGVILTFNGDDYCFQVADPDTSCETACGALGSEWEDNTCELMPAYPMTQEQLDICASAAGAFGYSSSVENDFAGGDERCVVKNESEGDVTKMRYNGYCDASDAPWDGAQRLCGCDVKNECSGASASGGGTTGGTGGGSGGSDGSTNSDPSDNSSTSESTSSSTSSSYSSSSSYVATTPQITILKSVQSVPVGPGGSFSFRVDLGNIGTGDATNVVVTDVVPAGVTITDADSCSVISGTITCPAITLSASSSTFYIFSATLNSDYCSLGYSSTATNTASYTADGPLSGSDDALFAITCPSSTSSVNPTSSTPSSDTSSHPTSSTPTSNPSSVPTSTNSSDPTSNPSSAPTSSVPSSNTSSNPASSTPTSNPSSNSSDPTSNPSSPFSSSSSIPTSVSSSSVLRSLKAVKTISGAPIDNLGYAHILAEDNSLTFTLFIENTGTETVENILLTDNLSTGFDAYLAIEDPDTVASDFEGCFVNFNNIQQVQCRVPSLAPGESKPFPVTVTTNASLECGVGSNTLGVGAEDVVINTSEAVALYFVTCANSSNPTSNPSSPASSSSFSSYSSLSPGSDSSSSQGDISVYKHGEPYEVRMIHDHRNVPGVKWRIVVVFNEDFESNGLQIIDELPEGMRFANIDDLNSLRGNEFYVFDLRVGFKKYYGKQYYYELSDANEDPLQSNFEDLTLSRDRSSGKRLVIVDVEDREFKKGDTIEFEFFSGFESRTCEEGLTNTAKVVDLGLDKEIKGTGETVCLDQSSSSSEEGGILISKEAEPALVSVDGSTYPGNKWTVTVRFKEEFESTSLSIDDYLPEGMEFGYGVHSNGERGARYSYQAVNFNEDRSENWRPGSITGFEDKGDYGEFKIEDRLFEKGDTLFVTFYAAFTSGRCEEGLENEVELYDDEFEQDPKATADTVCEYPVSSASSVYSNPTSTPPTSAPPSYSTPSSAPTSTASNSAASADSSGSTDSSANSSAESSLSSDSSSSSAENKEDVYVFVTSSFLPRLGRTVSNTISSINNAILNMVENITSPFSIVNPFVMFEDSDTDFITNQQIPSVMFDEAVQNPFNISNQSGIDTGMDLESINTMFESNIDVQTQPSLDQEIQNNTSEQDAPFNDFLNPFIQVLPNPFEIEP